MKKALSALLCAALFLSGCAMPIGLAPTPAAESAAPTPEATPTPAPTPKPDGEPYILIADGGHPLVSLDEAPYVTGKVGYYKLADGIFVENSYGNAEVQGDGAFRLFLGDTEALSYNSKCYASYAFCDLTGDGTEELILFLTPIMSNFVSGDLHVFSLGDHPEELLYFRGEPSFGDVPDMPLAGEGAYLALSASFGASANVSTEDPCLYYSCALCGVDVLWDMNRLFFLRLTNDMNEYETACTYLIWDGGWRVAEQRIILR
ncbi:MAG: hypothetical protein LLF87_06655 [Eubacteriales bacterium]|nr:hypothetical protein [Eubacteriales bacterium]